MMWLPAVLIRIEDSRGDDTFYIEDAGKSILTLRQEQKFDEDELLSEVKTVG
jgi:hypothetical protein